MEATSGYGTSTTFAGIQTTGTSILNFTYSDPKAMDYRPLNTSYVFAPKCDFQSALSNGQVDEVDSVLGAKYIIPGVPYKSNNWYGMEFECAYDSNPDLSGGLKFKLWAANVTITQSEGESVGKITGNISTTYSNNPSFDISLSFGDINSKSASITQSIENSSQSLGDKLDEEINKGTPFFTSIWTKIKSDLPSIAAQGVKSGVKALCTGGASLLTNVAGKLLNSVLGFGKEKTMTSLSEVKLKTNATIELSSSSSIVVAGWGSIADLPIPGCDATSKLYKEKLGVWNINKTPTVEVDLYSTAYFSAKENTMSYAIDPDKIPQDWEMEYDIRLLPIDVVVNPCLLNDFTLQHVKKELAFTSDIQNLPIGYYPYGLYNNHELYSCDSDRSIVIKEDSTTPIKLNGYNSNSSFDRPWENRINSLNKGLYCRVSFELKNRRTSEIIGFSKYFKVNALKGIHEHKDIREDNF